MKMLALDGARTGAARRAVGCRRPLTYERALELLRTVGAPGAEHRAKAEAQHNSPALARWLFLQGLWADVIPDDYSWPGKWFDPQAPVPAAIKRMLGKGIDPQDLTEVVRDAQIDVLRNVCQLLERADHGIEKLQGTITENVEWRLIEYDGNTGETGRLIEGLYDEFEELDSTGRSGAPRPRAEEPERKKARR